MTLRQYIAREHVFVEDLFAKWSNSLFPLERLDEAAQSGQSYAAAINRAAGEITETVGADVPEGVHIQPPAEAGAGEAHKLIARLGHQLHFHVVAADKEDLSLRVAFFPYIGHGNGGIDVSRRSAAGKYHIHTDSSCWSGRPKRRSCRLGRYRPLETARTMPISPRFTASAVPP